MGSFTAMPLLLIVAVFVTTLGGEGERVEAAAATTNNTNNGGEAAGALGIQECVSAFTNGAECIAVVYQAFIGGDPETAPICCKAMMGISLRCRLLMFPNPNVYPRFRTYCAARGVDPAIAVGDGSETLPPPAGTAGPPVTPSPSGR